MREIKSGDIVMRIRSTAMTPLFYKQEFGKDIMTDLKALDDENPEILVTLQLLWAINKTQNVAEKIQTKKFEEWLEEYQSIVLEDIVQDVAEELSDGFFRTNAQKGKGIPAK